MLTLFSRLELDESNRSSQIQITYDAIVFSQEHFISGPQIICITVVFKVLKYYLCKFYLRYCMLHVTVCHIAAVVQERRDNRQQQSQF